MIFFANKLYIRIMGVNGSDYNILLLDHQHCHVLNYDYEDQYLYWADAASKEIMRIKMDGKSLWMIK